MSSRIKVLLVILCVLSFTLCSCGGGGLVDGMQDANKALTGASEILHNEGWIK